MSSVFSALETSANGLHTYQTWLDAIADNIANVNTIRPFEESAFQTRYVVAESIGYGNASEPGVGNGSRVAGIAYSNGEGRLAFDPSHPMANEDGLIRMPDVDLSEQMTHMIVAQRAFQANVAAVERARNAYQAALSIGQG